MYEFVTNISIQFIMYLVFNLKPNIIVNYFMIFKKMVMWKCSTKDNLGVCGARKSIEISIRFGIDAWNHQISAVILGIVIHQFCYGT